MNLYEWWEIAAILGCAFAFGCGVRYIALVMFEWIAHRANLWLARKTKGRYLRRGPL